MKAESKSFDAVEANVGVALSKLRQNIQQWLDGFSNRLHQVEIKWVEEHGKQGAITGTGGKVRMTAVVFVLAS